MINEKTVFFSKLRNHIFYRKSGIWSGKVKKMDGPGTIGRQKQKNRRKKAGEYQNF